MKVKFPDYNNCITNIPNSILKYFGYEEGRKNKQPVRFLSEKRI